MTREEMAAKLKAIEVAVGGTMTQVAADVIRDVAEALGGAEADAAISSATTSPEVPVARAVKATRS